MHNHLEGNFNLSNKKALYYNLKYYCEATKVFFYHFKYTQYLK